MTRPTQTAAPIEVVLCAYNGEPYIRQQVDSILVQSLKPARLSIYDDVSTDGTRQLLEEIVRNNASGVEIVLHFNSQNLGYVKNFEQGIRKATLEFIALSDQDDIWEEDKLEVLFAEFDEDTGIAFSNALLVDRHAASLEHTLWDAIRLTPKRQAALRDRVRAPHLLLQQNYLTGAALVMRRSIVDALPPFPVAFASAHDYWIAIVAAEMTSLKPVDRVLYKYRQHEKNAIGQNKFSIGGRIVNALKLADARYRNELQTYEQLAQALDGLPGLEHTQVQYRAKAVFLRARQDAIASGLRGLAPLLCLLFTGQYRRFCRVGAGMFVKDASVLVARMVRGRQTGDSRAA
jgi:glycosyltransferase involved in cell wall biosynthesis